MSYQWQTCERTKMKMSKERMRQQKKKRIKHAFKIAYICHAAYTLTWSPRWRHSHEKHGERLIDDEILETFIIDGDTEDLSNLAREHDRPILVVDMIKERSDNYRKEGLLLTSYSTPKKKTCCQKNQMI